MNRNVWWGWILVLGLSTGCKEKSDSSSEPAAPPPATSTPSVPETGGTVPAETVAVSGKVLIEDGFESGDYSAWSSLWTTQDVTINSNAMFVRSGSHSAKLHYVIPATSGAEHQDTNRWFEFKHTGVDHVLVRGYVYFGPHLYAGVARKLYYFKDPSGPDGSPNFHWAVVLGTFGYDLAMGPGPYDSTATEADFALSWNLYRFQPGRWYRLETEIKANTPGMRDGYVKVWVDGLLVLIRTNMNLRGNFTTKLTRFEIGRQADRVDYMPVDEYRYWDDLLILENPVVP